MATPDGGRLRKTLYYGPWQCRQVWLDECRSKCAAQKLTSMGCIWVADIKTEFQKTVGFLPVEMGGRLAVTHCCCNYPKVKDLVRRRNEWKAGREKYRREWSKEYGDWPQSADETNWPGHHVHDLQHGGAPMSRDILPVPPDNHDQLNVEYPRCYDWNR